MCEPDTEELEARHREALRRYAELLAACDTVRLTGPRDAGELYFLHVLDCLRSVPLLPPGERAQVIDVGTGGGLPGIVWAVCRPDISVALLDSVGKKCRALEDIVKALNLENVQVTCGRSEDIARTMRERFDLACARAVASVGVTAELLSPLVKVKGRLLTFKGPKLAGELAEVMGRWARLGLNAPLELGYDDGSERRLVLWEKVAPCSKTYPRRPGMAMMKGWWL